MKTKTSLIILLFMQFLCTSPQSIATDDDTNQSQREKRLSMAFTELFGDIAIAIKGDALVFCGSQYEVDLALSKLNNFDEIRKTVVPVTSQLIKTQAHKGTNFSSWQDFTSALGIPQQELRNFATQNSGDINGTLQIPYDSKFNITLANAYVTELKRLSPYFDWISRHNPEFLRYENNTLSIMYHILTEHFCSPQVQVSPVESSDNVTASLSLHCVLNKISAAAGSDISLVATQVPGEYHVRTVMHGAQFGNITPSLAIDIVLDKSGSMAGAPIDTLNAKTPLLLQELRHTLKDGESLNVTVYKFDTLLDVHQTYILRHGDDAQIKWTNLTANGGTDLTLVGSLLKLKQENERRIVIAFTDGAHEASGKDINKDYAYLKELQLSTQFAQPFFCKVGAYALQEPYFDNVSSIFAGSCQKSATMDDFFRTVQANIRELLIPNVPLVLTINGIDATIRQTCADPDIHTTKQTVKQKDIVRYKGTALTVNPSLSEAASGAPTTISSAVSLISTADAEPLQQRIAMLEAELERLRLEACAKK